MGLFSRTCKTCKNGRHRDCTQPKRTTNVWGNPRLGCCCGATLIYR